MDSKTIRWQREKDCKLALYISEDGINYIRYNNHHLYKQDYELSSNSGFRTAQNLLKLGYKYENKEVE